MLCSNSTRKSFRLNNSSAVELPPIMGSRTAVNARYDRPGATFMPIGGPQAHLTPGPSNPRDGVVGGLFHYPDSGRATAFQAAAASFSTFVNKVSRREACGCDNLHHRRLGNDWQTR